MNAIYLHPTDGFTFLENVPEKPIFTTNGFKDYQTANQAFTINLESYERALAESKKNGIKIDNPEALVIIPELINSGPKEGELYPWPGTYYKQWQIKSSTGPKFSWLNCNEAVAKDKPGFSPREVVILSLPKEEKTPGYAGIDFHPNDVEPVNSSMSEKDKSDREIIDLVFPPEPVVSQDQEEQGQLWKEARKLIDAWRIDELFKKFTITRNP